MSLSSLLYRHDYPINESIKIVIPTVGNILQNEDEYYGLVMALTAMPIDFMVQLDDIGVDFTTINEYELFLKLFPLIQQQNTSFVFGDLDLSKFRMAVNPQNNMIVLVNDQGVIIDRKIQGQIANVLRKIHRFEKNNKRPGNDEAKRYMLQRAREKAQRKRSSASSQLEPLIVAMVNTSDFKYDFDSVLGLTIYQFNESVRQISHYIQYNNTMHGVYAGTIDPKGLSKDALSWVVFQ